uniref:TPM domain-containing protein n=2 Tax=Oscillospiraceae TaxID=216572 RepID=UPI003FF0A1E3
MKFFQKRAVAAVVLILAIVAGVVIGQAKKPDTGGQASTAIVGSYTYVYDYAGVLTDETMEHIDAMNASLFAQTGAQILVSVVNSTGGADIMDYASDLGNSYGVGSAERNNGVVMLLALDNISQSGLMGDYCVVVGTGLESHADDFMSLQSYYLENDFAAGEYDAGVKATFDAFIAWFADFYGVTIREGYIPAVRETYSSGSGYYYTETHGYVAPALGSLVSGVVVLLVVLLVLWVILDGMRYSRYRRRYLRPGMGRPTVLYYP